MLEANIQALAVEDHPPDARLLLEYMKGSPGYTLHHVVCLADALSAASDQQFDVVLLDLNLPDSTGLDTLQAICDAFPELAIVVLTGLDDPASGRAAIQRGAQDYLVKGQFDERDLMRAIRYAVERNSLHISLARERTRLADAVAERTAELKATNDELAAAMEAKDRFLASMSHELRTPLSGMLLMAEVLSEQVYGPLTTRQEDCVRRIDTAGHHLLALINDVLDVAKLKSGRASLELESVGLSDVCRRAIELVAPTAASKQTRLVLDELKDAVFVADSRRIVQILVNLLSNAVKFSPEDSTVQLTATARPTCIEFAVADQGPGISQQDIETRLFRPFSQLPSNGGQRPPGTGLGLTLVKQLTESHGGEVRVESRPGHGAKFVVCLPRDNVGTSPPAHTEPQPANNNGRSGATRSQGMRVLIVEDDPISREAVSSALEATGFVVDTAADGPTGLQLATTSRYDAVIMDIHLPGMNGLDVVRQIRADESARATPVVVATASAMQGDRERCMQAGASHYMAKPISLAALRKWLGSLADEA